ncbi:MAG: ATP-binding protein, partial [Clostridiaceae bacterium]|nr:ATP-binding protein [Clostridiaceae bacterium]
DTKRILGAAFDIGTTTLAAWLYDLESGDRLGVSSRYNPQRSFGADVISRIEKVDKDAGNLAAMQKQIARALAEMAEEMLMTSGLKGYDLHFMSISGNTTMMHILSGLNPSAISRSPFVPVSTSEQLLRASILGIEAAGNPICLLLPSISAYAGADITAGIMACGLFKLEKENKLLVDLGTNGEIVLSLPSGMTACSTAAGPAFEAANISCGMSGIAGAIDKVWLENGSLKHSVIGGSTAKGLCGSGLVSAVATLLQAGIIDETGRLTDEPEELSAELSARCSELEGMKIFWLDRPDGEIYLSQRDIRELQNAKAAVAAGVMRLLKQTGTQPEELDEVLLAGGFGYYLNVDDAYTIGLLPSGARNKTKAVGNTSGMGAVACMLNDELRQEAVVAASSVEYFELSSDPVFTELYIEAMMFPEQE